MEVIAKLKQGYHFLDQPVDCVYIAGRSFAKGGLQSKYSERKWRFSSSIRENISQTVTNMATVIINHQ